MTHTTIERRERETRSAGASEGVDRARGESEASDTVVHPIRNHNEVCTHRFQPTVSIRVIMALRVTGSGAIRSRVVPLKSLCQLCS
eukprot:51823-Rhodomonas_salina.3